MRPWSFQTSMNLGGMETGEISRRVSLFLYAIGAVSLALGWLKMATLRDLRGGWGGLGSFCSFCRVLALLLALILMHRGMGRGWMRE